MTDKKVELYLVLNNLIGEVTRLRKAGSRGPLDEVLDNYDKLISTLMAIRTVAGDLAELDSGRADCMWLLQAQMTKEILRLTSVETFAAAAGSGNGVMGSNSATRGVRE